MQGSSCGSAVPRTSFGPSTVKGKRPGRMSSGVLVIDSLSRGVSGPQKCDQDSRGVDKTGTRAVQSLRALKKRSTLFF